MWPAREGAIEQAAALAEANRRVRPERAAGRAWAVRPAGAEVELKSAAGRLERPSAEAPVPAAQPGEGVRLRPVGAQAELRSAAGRSAWADGPVPVPAGAQAELLPAVGQRGQEGGRGSARVARTEVRRAVSPGPAVAPVEVDAQVLRLEARRDGVQRALRQASAQVEPPPAADRSGQEDEPVLAWVGPAEKLEVAPARAAARVEAGAAAQREEARRVVLRPAAGRGEAPLEVPRGGEQAALRPAADRSAESRLHAGARPLAFLRSPSPRHVPPPWPKFLQREGSIPASRRDQENPDSSEFRSAPGFRATARDA